MRNELAPRELANAPRLKRFFPEKRLALVEFVFGNICLLQVWNSGCRSRVDAAQDDARA